MKERWLLFLAVMPLAVAAQDAAVERQLMQRQQQSDAFSLQLRQSLERQRVAPTELGRRRQLDSRQIAERNRLDDLGQEQLLETRRQTPRYLRPYERRKADDERRQIVAPAGGIVRPD